jgi:hypothetical protein
VWITTSTDSGILGRRGSVTVSGSAEHTRDAA